MVRRFLPSGQKTFSFKTSIPKERQKYLWVHVTDVKGREAISRAIDCNSWILREYQCGDRNNQLLYSRQKRPDGSPFFIGYGGDTAMPDKGPWNGRIRPVGCFVFDKKLGIGATHFDGSPERASPMLDESVLVYDGKRPKARLVNHLVADREGAAHVRPHRVVASSEVLVGDRVLDGVFPLTCTIRSIYVWHSVFPFAPSKYFEDHGPDDFLSRQARRRGLLPVGSVGRTTSGRSHTGVAAVCSSTPGILPAAAPNSGSSSMPARRSTRETSSRMPSEPSRSTRATMSASSRTHSVRWPSTASRTDWC